MTHFLLPTTTLLLLLITLSPPPTTTATTTTTTTAAVLDINNHPLQSKTAYHILPVLRGRGGGLTLTPQNTTTPCPLNVAQDPQEVSQGLPLKLYPLNPKQRHISLSSDLNIVFDAATVCIQPTGWALAIDEPTGRRYVEATGRVGSPGVGTLDNWFKIEKVESGVHDYKIVYCPSVCKFCKVMCGDLGVFIEEDGRRLLGFSDKPLLVMFKKA